MPGKDGPMTSLRFWLSLLFLLGVQSSALAQRLLGTTVRPAGGVGHEVRLLPEGRLAIVYDEIGPGRPRARLLDASGRLTDVPVSMLKNPLFDQFAWSDREQTVYALAYHGAVFRLDQRDKIFRRVGGTPLEFHDIHYFPRLGRVLLVGRHGLSVVRDGRIVPVRSAGVRLPGLFELRDMPNFQVLLLGNDKQQFLRTADGHIHAIGDGRIEQARELERRNAIQLVGPTAAFDITMKRSPDGVWSPARVRRIALAWGRDRMLRSFAPSQDAFVVAQPGWFDHWLDRSGLYVLGPDGLRPIGDGRQRGASYPHLSALPSKRLDVLMLDRGRPGTTEFWALRAGDDVRRQHWPAGLARFPIIGEATGLTYVIGSTGIWLWDGGARLLRLANYRSAKVHRLPITGELLFSDGRSAVVVDRSFRVTRVPGFAPGDVLQTAPDRVIVIGRKIIEYPLPRRA
jgi:hypothetical protein